MTTDYFWGHNSITAIRVLCKPSTCTEKLVQWSALKQWKAFLGNATKRIFSILKKKNQTNTHRPSLRLGDCLTVAPGLEFLGQSSVKQNLAYPPIHPNTMQWGEGEGRQAWSVQPARDVTESAWPAGATSPERRRSHCPSFTHARGVLYMTRRFRRVQAVNSHSVIGKNILRAATRAFRPSADSLRPALDAPRCAAKV